MMDKKLILFDIDGTLIDCQHNKPYLSDYTKYALQKLKQQGHYIFIASGRPYCYLIQELREFPFDGYILNDGALILLSDNQNISHPINPHKLSPIIEQVIHKNLTFIGYAQKYAYVYNDDGSLLDYAKTFLIDEQFIQYVDSIDDIKEDLFKIHVQCHYEKDYHHFQFDAQQFYSSDDHQHLLKEIYSRKYTKATALIEVLKILNIPISNSYFFGDGMNDIEMLDTVGHGIVMDNAQQEVKKHADDICFGVLEDGVARFIMESDVFF